MLDENDKLVERKINYIVVLNKPGTKNRAKADAAGGVQEVGVEFVGQVAIGQATLSDAAMYPPRLVKVRGAFFGSGGATKNNVAAPSSKATEQASTNLTPKQVDKRSQSIFVTNAKSINGASVHEDQDSSSDMETEEDESSSSTPHDRKRKSNVLGEHNEQQPPPPAQPPVVPLPPVVQEQPLVQEQPPVVPLPPVVQEEAPVVPLPLVVQEEAPVVQEQPPAQQGDWIEGHFVPALERLRNVQGQQLNDVKRYYKFQTGGTMTGYDRFPQRVKQEWGRRMRAQCSALNGRLFG